MAVVTLGGYREKPITPNKSGGFVTTGALYAGDAREKPAPTSGAINRPIINDNTVQSTEQPRYRQIVQGGALVNVLDTSAPGVAGEPNLEDIRQKEISRAQAMIDATQGLYLEGIRNIREQGQRDLQETSSLQVGAGLAGSPFKQAAEQKQTDRTEKAVLAESQRRQAEIARLMGLADEKAEQKYAQERDFFVSERDKANVQMEKRQTEAKETAKQLAGQGYSLSELDSQQKQKLMQDTGYDEFQLELFYNANKPQPQRSDIKYVTKGDKMIGYYTEFDAKGQPTIKSFESQAILGIDDKVEYTTQIADDGTVLLIPKQFDPNKPIKDQIVEYGQFQKPAEAEKPQTIGSDKVGYYQYDGETKSWTQIVAPAEDKGGANGGASEAGLVETVLNNPSLFNQLTPTEKGKIAPMLSELGFTGFGKPLSDTAIEKITQSETAIGLLKDLRQSVQDNIQYLGPLNGLQALNPWSEAKQVQAQISLVKQNIGKALEGGVLRKEDEEKYKQILATVTDTPENALFKIDNLLKTIEADVQRYKDNQALSGRNVPTEDPLNLDNTKDPLGLGFKSVDGDTNKAVDAKRIAAAIRQVESGGNYSAKGGSGEYGAYQFMPSSWKSWAQKYLGDANASMTPANQDKVAEAHISSLVAKGYGPKEIALIWNGGQPVVKRGVNKFGVKYDSGAYANKVLKALS